MRSEACRRYAPDLYSPLASRFSPLVSRASAQSPQPLQNTVQNPYMVPETNPDVPKNLHTYTQSVMLEVVGSLYCLLAGVNPLDASGKCLGFDPQTKKLGYVDNQNQQVGGAIGMMTNFIGYTYNIPGSSTEYFAYLSSNFGLVKKAHAQGAGFTSLSPIMEVWKAFRNVTYLGFVLIFVIIGFAIMVRIPIDQRTFMTIQNQIPKIIVTLILITFSFAIAGFLIDLMWILIFLVFNILSSVPGVQFGPDYITQLSGSNPISYLNGTVGLNSLISDSSGAFASVVSQILNNPVGIAIASVISLILGGGGGAAAGSIFGPVGTVIGGAIGAILGGINTALNTEGTLQLAGYVIAYLIIFIAVFSALFRLWIELLKAYVFTLLDIVIAPFWIAAGLFPGSSSGFGTWLRDIGANLSSFVATAILFFFARVMLDLFGQTQTASQFIPPFIGNPGSNSAIGILIALGVILLTPEVLNITRDAFKAPQVKYMAAIGQGIGVGQATIGTFAGGVGSRLWRTNSQGQATGFVNSVLYSRFGNKPIGAVIGTLTGGWSKGATIKEAAKKEANTRQQAIGAQVKKTAEENTGITPI